MQILLRFNHNADSELNRWRFIHDQDTPGQLQEILCAEVAFLCHTKTVATQIQENGATVTKWHVTPIKPDPMFREVNERVRNSAGEFVNRTKILVQ